MKVLTFTTLYPNNVWPNNGVFIKERMTFFAKLNGVEVKVVAPVPYFPDIRLGSRWRYSQVKSHQLIEGLEVYHPQYFMTPKIGMSFYGLTMFWSVLPVVKKIQREFNFDIIDAHYLYPDGYAATLLSNYFKKPVVVSARGSDINLYGTFPIIRKFLRQTLLKANKVVAVCQALKKGIVQLGVPEEKVSVIPNGVDSYKFCPAPKEEIRRRLKLLDKKIILSVGHLTPNKGFDYLIKALKILQTELNKESVYLVIVGEGEFRKELEKTISLLNLEEDVKLAGAIPHEELRDWYSAADVFCLASQQEGWPNVILESLACGTPVVATSAGGIPEIISSNSVGILAERTEQDIAQKISIALKQSWNRDEIVKFAEEYTWNRVALQVYDVFKSVLNNRSSNKLTH
ncbi:MAG TPA: glycosyltransferase family 4 protein [Syntrophales bacterium]|nr:glycosyltransferase family 4 protein [Syntrophales bacterium]